MKVFSYGGGVQSTAALVLAAQGKIDYQTFLFCNVGVKAENPDTLEYVDNVAKPFAEAHNIELIEIQRRWQKGERAGQVVDLYETLINPKSRTAGGIPIRLGSGAPGNRSCTVDFKIEVVDRWLKERGAKGNGAIVGLGISLDEYTRARTGIDPEKPWKTLAYPLLNEIQLPNRATPGITRQDCMNIIADASLPVPPKSSCYFCPFHTIHVWQEMRNKQPDLFKKACDLEDLMRKRSILLGKGDIWFTGKQKPLAMVTTDYVQGNLFEDDDQICDSGYCFM